MSGLREDVRIVTPSGKLKGYLYVGPDGLPKLLVYNSISRIEHYTPATFPAAWMMLMGDDDFQIGPLFEAWRDIEDARQSIVEAQREAEQETPEPEERGQHV